MSNSDSTIERPDRSVSGPVLGTRLFGFELSRKIRARKTLILLAIQFLPAIIAAIALFWQDLDGLVLFEGTVDGVYLPLLLPLAALFFGGPTIVDEVEGRTITFLTLRPLSRTVLFGSKLAASMVLTVAVTTIPIVLFFLVCALGTDAGFADGIGLLGAAVGTTAVGAITYTAVFAMLGVIFTSTLLPGIVYYVVFELIFASIPIVEFLSIKFHLFTLGGFDRFGDEAEQGLRKTLEQMLLDQPLDPHWWVGLIVTGLVTAGAVVVAAGVFRTRQFHV